MAEVRPQSSRPARRGGVAVAAAVAALAVLAVPRAGGAPPTGPSAAAALGTDVPGLAFDAAGRLYAADRQNDRVLVLGLDDAVLATIGAGRLDAPTGVAVAPDGDVLVSDGAGVHRFAPDGTPVAAWAAADAAGLAAGAGGTVWVSEPDRVARFTGDGAPLGAFAADDPRGIAVAADGTLWVGTADGLAHVTASGAPVLTTPADHAEGVAIAADDSILVAERERDRVARFAADGTPGAPIEDGFDEPRGIAVDCAGNVAVADDSPARIHRIPSGAGPPPCRSAFGAVVAPAPAPTVAPSPPVARRPTVTPLPAPGLLPALGRTAFAAAAAGDVLVRLPGERAPATLRPGTLLPLGTSIDARDGRVTLHFATRTADFDTLGTTQTGVFEGGLFTIVQRRDSSRVDVRLEGDRPRCGLPASASPVTGRHLWSDVHGLFRVRGTSATATARSARWLTEDRCAGTLVRVVRGSVRVRDRVRGGTVTVRSGRRVLVRPPRRG